MPSFSKRSSDNLATCDSVLQNLFNHIIKDYDCTIIEGFRPHDRQTQLYNAGKSKVKHGKHNVSPSEAVDVAPYIPGRGIPWPDKEKRPKSYIKDLAQFYHFAGYVLGVAKELGVEIRYGGDWDRDHDVADQTFDDLVHFEIVR